MANRTDTQLFLDVLKKIRNSDKYKKANIFAKADFEDTAKEWYKQLGEAELIDAQNKMESEIAEGEKARREQLRKERAERNPLINWAGDVFRGLGEHSLGDAASLAALLAQTVGVKDTARSIADWREDYSKAAEQAYGGKAEWTTKENEWKPDSVWSAIDSAIGTTIDVGTLFTSPLMKGADKLLGGVSASGAKLLAGASNPVLRAGVRVANASGIVGKAKALSIATKIATKNGRNIWSATRAGLGALAGATPTAVGMSLAELYQDQIKTDNAGHAVLPHSVIPTYALAPLHGLIEHMGIDPRKPFTKSIRKSVKKFITDYFAEMPARALGEGTEEFLQDGLSFLDARLSSDVRDNGEPNTVFTALTDWMGDLYNKFPQLAQSFILGGLGGALIPEGINSVKSNRTLEAEKQNIQSQMPDILALADKIELTQTDADRAKLQDDIEKAIEGYDLTIADTSVDMAKRQLAALDKKNDILQKFAIEDSRNRARARELINDYVYNMDLMHETAENPEDKNNPLVLDSYKTMADVASERSRKRQVENARKIAIEKTEEDEANGDIEKQALDAWNDLSADEQETYHNDFNEWYADNADNFKQGNQAVNALNILTSDKSADDYTKSLDALSYWLNESKKNRWQKEEEENDKKISEQNRNVQEKLYSNLINRLLKEKEDKYLTGMPEHPDLLVDTTEEAIKRGKDELLEAKKKAISDSFEANSKRLDESGERIGTQANIKQAKQELPKVRKQKKQLAEIANKLNNAVKKLKATEPTKRAELNDLNARLNNGLKKVAVNGALMLEAPKNNKDITENVLQGLANNGDISEEEAKELWEEVIEYEKEQAEEQENEKGYIEEPTDEDVEQVEQAEEENIKQKSEIEQTTEKYQKEQFDKILEDYNKNANGLSLKDFILDRIKFYSNKEQNRNLSEEERVNAEQLRNTYLHALSYYNKNEEDNEEKKEPNKKNASKIQVAELKSYGEYLEEIENGADIKFYVNFDDDSREYNNIIELSRGNKLKNGGYNYLYSEYNGLTKRWSVDTRKISWEELTGKLSETIELPVVKIEYVKNPVAENKTKTKTKEDAVKEALGEKTEKEKNKEAVRELTRKRDAVLPKQQKTEQKQEDKQQQEQIDNNSPIITDIENIDYKNAVERLATHIVELFDGKKNNNWLGQLVFGKVSKLEPKHGRIMQELFEGALCKYIRDNNLSLEQVLTLYNNQPTLNVRTLTQSLFQAYSTPVVLAKALTDIFDIKSGDTVFEPTAGNGLLLSSVNKDANFILNELQKARNNILQAIFGDVVTNENALKMNMPKADYVITNPPFGKNADTKKAAVEMPKLNEAEKTVNYIFTDQAHIIAANALKAMKSNGKSIIIYGSPLGFRGQEGDKREGSGARFENFLFNYFNVAGIFEIDGKLYGKQGAQFPVVCVVVDGKRNTNHSLYDTRKLDVKRFGKWEEVFKECENIKQRITDRKDILGNEFTDQLDDLIEEVKQEKQQKEIPVENKEDTTKQETTNKEQTIDKKEEKDLTQAAKEKEEKENNISYEETNEQLAEGKQEAEKKAVNKQEAPVEEIGDGKLQTRYEPVSTNRSIGALVPTNLAKPINLALKLIRDTYGDLTELVAKMTGNKKANEVFSAEQIDALAMYADKLLNKKAMVCADQTGLGKGRVAAGAIQMSIHQGHIPFFCTEVDGLFSDLYRDLKDTGAENLRPFFLNSNGFMSYEDENGNLVYAYKQIPNGERNRVIKHLIDGDYSDFVGKNAKYDYIVGTYSQFQNSDTNAKARNNAILNLLQNNTVDLILDEAHNAASDPTSNSRNGSNDSGEKDGQMTYKRFLKFTESANSILFMSATWAKRSGNMSLYSRAIGKKVNEIETLLATDSQGMQELLINDMAIHGNYIRREQSFEGVQYTNEVVTTKEEDIQKEVKNSDDYNSLILRAIKLSQSVTNLIKNNSEFIDNVLEKEYGEMNVSRVKNDKKELNAEKGSTSPFNVVHNYVNSLLLALKADRVAEEAIKQIKAGLKPVICLEKTAGTQLESFANANGLEYGNTIKPFSMADVFEGLVLGQLKNVSVETNTGETVKIDVPYDMLPSDIRKDFETFIDDLKKTNLSELTGSPIDRIKYLIKKAGYSVDEITGRNAVVNYQSDNEAIYESRGDKGTKAKREIINRFNSGSLDCVLLNESGSTGISLHASSKFADQRQRIMLIAQPFGDINTMMQMLGRIHRVGQVKLPIYKYIMTSLLQENRVANNLQDKLKSLNANTSSNKESTQKFSNVDINNRYGSKAMNDWLQENVDIALYMELARVEENGEIKLRDGLDAKKITGRIAIMPQAIQSDFWDSVLETAQDLKEQAMALGNDDTQIVSYDNADAYVLSSRRTKGETISDDYYFKSINMAIEGKPATIDNAMARANQGKTVADDKEFINELKTQAQTYVNATQERINKGIKIKLSTVKSRMEACFKDLMTIKPGMWLKSKNGELGIVTDVKITKTKDATTKNPITESKIKITLASPTKTGTTIINLSIYHKDAWTEVTSAYDQNDFQKEWKAEYDSNSTHREVAEAVTGNLINANEIARFNGLKVSQVQFRTKDGGHKIQFVYLSRGKDIMPASEKLEKVEQSDFSSAKTFKYVFGKKGGKESYVQINLYRSGNAYVSMYGVSKTSPQYKFMETYFGGDNIRKYGNRLEIFIVDDNVLAKVNDFINAINKELNVQFDKTTTDKDVLKAQAQQYKESLPQEFEEDDVHYSLRKSAVTKPININKLNSIVKTMAKAVKQKLGLDIVACKDIAELKQKLGLDKIPENAEGCVRYGKIYLVASNLQDNGRAFEVLAHEIAGHIGAEKLFKGFDDMMNNLLSLEKSDKQIKALFARVRRQYPTLQGTGLAKEVFARVMEQVYNNETTLTGKLKNLVNYFISKIKNFFRALNIPLSTSSREIYGIARDILVNKTRFMDLKQGKVTGDRYKLKYSKNKPVFAIKNLYTMSGSDYSKPSLVNVKAGIDYDNYYGLYATDKPYDENDIDKGTNVYTQTFFNDKADGKEKILDMQKELTKEERANIADGLQKHIENKLGYLLEPALNIEEGTAWANDVAKHKKAKKLMDKLNEIRNGDFTSGGSIYHSIRNILSDFKPEAQKYNSNYTHKMARDFLLSIGYDGIIDDWRGKRRQIVSFRDDNITVDRHQKAVDYGKLEDVNELTDEKKDKKKVLLDKAKSISKTIYEKAKKDNRIDEIKEKISKPIVAVKPNSVETNGLKIIEAATEWFKNNPTGNANTVIGEVIIDANSISDSFGHTKYRNKLDTIPAIKPVLEKGAYLGEYPDIEGKPLKNHYFVGKIKIGNDEQILFVRTREARKASNRFYVHEVFTEKEIKEKSERLIGDSVLQTEATNHSDLYRIIIYPFLNVKNSDSGKQSTQETLADILNPANYKGKMYSVENLIAEVATKLVKWGINKTIDAAKNMMKYMLNAYHRFNRNYNDWKNEISKSSIIEKKMTEEQLKEVFADIEKEENAVIKVGDEVDATGFDEYLDERAEAEGITSKEDIKKAKELARIAKKKAIGEKYLEQQRKINEAIEKSRETKESTFKDKIEAVENWLALKLANHRHKLEQFQNDITKVIKRDLPDWINPHRLLDTIDGRIQHKIEAFNEKYYKPLYDYIVKNKITYEDFNLFTYAMHADERDKHIWDINPNFKENNVRGSGWDNKKMGGTTDEVLKKLFDKYGEKTLIKAGEMFWKMNDEVIELQRRYNLISDEVADTIKKRYKHYTPLKRIADDEVTTQVVERALGRTSTAEDNLMFAVAAIDTTIRWGEKNNAKMAMLNLVNMHPTSMVVTNREAIKQVFNEETGEVEYAIDRKTPPNTLFVRWKDNYYSMTFKDEDLYKAFVSEKRNSEAWNAIVKISRSFTNVMGFVSTMANPDFGASNFVRDQTQSGLENLMYRGYNFAKNAFAYAIPAIKTFVDYKRGIDNAETRLYKEFLENGGMTGYADILRLDERATNLQKAIMEDIEASESLKGKAKKIVKNPAELIHKVFKYFELFNDALESATRFGIYKQARGKNANNSIKAAELAKNITINFNRHGSLWSSDMNALYLFSNASLQGTRKSYRLLKEASKSKKGIALISSLALAGFIAEMLGNMFAGFDPDDEKNYYEKLDDWKKDGNIILFVPNSKKYVSIPLSPVAAFPYMIGRNIAAYINGKKSMVNAFGDMFNNFINGVNPLGEDNKPFGSVIPTAARPLVEMWTNQKWNGSKIRPEQGEHSTKKPRHQLYYEENTHKAFVEFTKWLSDITGGDEYNGGLLDFSPADIQYLFENYTGGLGKSITKGYRTLTGQSDSLDDMPIVRRFVNETNDYSVPKEYRNNKDIALKYNKIKSENKDYLKLDRYTNYKRISDIMKVSDKQIERIRKKKSIPTSEMEKKILQIQKQANAAIRRL